jgi:anti-anti-sigma regulatory factor
VLLLRVVRPGKGPYFRLFGALEASSVWTLTTTVLRHVHGGDVVLDLADLMSVDGDGIGGFVEIARSLSSGSELTLLSPRPPVARALERSGVLETVPNVVLFFTHDPSGAKRRWSSELLPLPRAPREPAVLSLDQDRQRLAAPSPGPQGNGSEDHQAPGELGSDGHQRFVWLG